MHSLARRLGLLNCSYQLNSSSGPFVIPLWRTENLIYCWNYQGYERDVFDRLKEEFAECGKDALLVDAGADIGLFSAKAKAIIPTLKKVFAFEPNGAVLSILNRNLASLGIEVHGIGAALSDYEGRADLAKSDYDKQDTARFIEQQNEGGGVLVTTVDAALKNEELNVLLIKADVEGEELPLIHGAASSIKRAGRAYVLFEANPDVSKRTRIDPADIMRALLGMKPFRFSVCEQHKTVLDPDRRFFDQLPPNRVYNVLAVEE